MKIASNVFEYLQVYVCEMEMDLQICLKRNIHNRTEDEINRIIDYFEPTPSYHQKLDVNSMLQEQAIEEVFFQAKLHIFILNEILIYILLDFRFIWKIVKKRRKNHLSKMKIAKIVKMICKMLL